MKKHFSIRRYLTFYTLLWVTIMTLLPAIWVYLDAKHEVDELFDASLSQSARVLHGLINRESVDSNAQHLKKSLQAKDLGLDHFSEEEYNEDGHEYEKKVAFQIRELSGEVILKSASAPDTPLAPLQKGYQSGEIDGYGWRTFTLFSEHDQWWLTVSERDDIRNEINANIIHGHVWPVLIVTPILALLIWNLIGRSLRPLQHLSRQLDQRHYQDLDTLDDQKSPEETLGLVNAMNQLFQRLNTAYQKESRFAGDAAHELRNPLASLLIHTENALEDNQAYLEKHSTPDQQLQQHLEQQQSDLSQVKQGIGRLSHIVQQLLALSRAEADQQTADGSFSLSELCQDTVAQHQLAAGKKQQTLRPDIEPDCKGTGNSPLINSLLNNLISNAINYTPEGGEIKVSCKAQRDSGQAPEVILQVEDSGPGIPTKDIERVKDRFYRVQGNSSYGVGLGLSIVQAIVERHNAQWDMKQSALGGLCVTIKFNR